MREACVVWPGAVRAIIGLSVALALACGGGAMAEGPDDLYRAQTIVTGQGETNRLIGFGACLEDVLIKVSGAQQLAGRPRPQAIHAAMPIALRRP